MKTNIYKRLLISAILVGSLTGCSESGFLDLKDPNNLTEAQYWKTETDVWAAMATVYSPIRGQMYGYFGAFTGFQNMNVRGDDVWAVPNDEKENWDITIFLNNSNTKSDWGSLYTSIERANVLLANIDRVAFKDENKKKAFIGEALFLRGFNYFLLATNYGYAPLNLKPILTTEDSMNPAVSEGELWKQVESDLSEAEKLLPESRPSTEAGRVVRGAATAYLGKAYISQHKYVEAEKELSTLIKSGRYDLMPNYEDNFTPAFEFNKESIFELNYAAFGSSTWGYEGNNSTQGMVLPQFIGTPITGGWFKMMPSAYIIEEYLKEERSAGSDSKFDKRMYTNFFFKYSDYGDVKPDEKWYNKSFTMDDLWKSTAGKRAVDPPKFPVINGKEGRFLPKKYTTFYSNLENGDSMYNPVPVDNNFRVMRYAEVLLLHAEAAAELGKTTEAAADLTKIRNRAGLSSKTWSGKSELLAEIEHQNLLEFFFEGKRFFDMKRMHNASQMRDMLIGHKKQGANNFQEKHLVFPIPQTEVDANSRLKQNPLWQ